MSIEQDIQKLTKTVQALLTFLEANPHATTLSPGVAVANTTPLNPPVPDAVQVQPQGSGTQVPNAEQRAAAQIHSPEHQADVIAAAHQGGFTPQVVTAEGQVINPVNANTAPLDLNGVNLVLQAEMVRLGDQGMPIILSILQKYGSQRLGEINPQRYPQLVAEVQGTHPQGVA